MEVLFVVFNTVSLKIILIIFRTGLLTHDVGYSASLTSPSVIQCRPSKLAHCDQLSTLVKIQPPFSFAPCSPGLGGGGGNGGHPGGGGEVALPYVSYKNCVVF